jgi:hypothetical protein
MTDDPYDILGVARTAEPEVIHAAWLALSKKHHPDSGTEPDPVAMAAINSAHDLLTDPVRRARWDAQGGNPDGDGNGAATRSSPFGDDPVAPTGDAGWGDGSDDVSPPLDHQPAGSAPVRADSAPARATSRDDPYAQGWQSAVQLVNAVASGYALPVAPTSLVLAPGEVSHCSVSATLSAYFGLDEVDYGGGNSLVAGKSWAGIAVTGAASMMWNSHKRKKAERQAAPRWRTLGTVPLDVTNQRLVTVIDGRLQSFWMNGEITVFDPQFQRYTMVIQAEGGAPLMFTGPAVPYAAAIMHMLLRGGQVPSLAVPG